MSSFEQRNMRALSICQQRRDYSEAPEYWLGCAEDYDIEEDTDDDDIDEEDE